MGRRFVSQIYKHLLMQLGEHRPYECVMIGDNLDLDIKNAKTCGINTIWVNSKNETTNDIKTISVNDIKTISVNDINIITESLINSLT